ncbi:hypothetical protein E4U54_003798, partial [Claviceps lovelessii]
MEERGQRPQRPEKRSREQQGAAGSSREGAAGWGAKEAADQIGADHSTWQVETGRLGGSRTITRRR